jgi:hypothetical protein
MICFLFLAIDFWNTNYSTFTLSLYCSDQNFALFMDRSPAANIRDKKNGILERKRYNEIPPRVEYTLTTKGQELVESVVNILQWMRKWANSKKGSPKMR